MNNQMNAEAFDRLKQLFMEELSAYDFLVETMKDKQNAIIENDLKKIQLHTYTEQVLVNKINTLTDSRQKLMKHILTKQEADPLLMEIREFFNYFELRVDPVWARLEKRLIEVAEKIQRLNFENRELIEASVYFVQNMIRLFYPEDHMASNLYTSEGSGEQKVKTNLLDCNV